MGGRVSDFCLTFGCKISAASATLGKLSEDAQRGRNDIKLYHAEGVCVCGCLWGVVWEQGHSIQRHVMEKPSSLTSTKKVPGLDTRRALLAGHPILGRDGPP